MRTAVALLIMTLTALTWVPLDVSPARAAFTDSDGDGAIDLAEEIFGSDPADALSTPETTDFPLLPPSGGCSDGLDNDGDGAVDAADPGCVDSDGGYPSDETERILGSDPNDDESFPEDSRLGAVFAAQGYLYAAFSICSDGIDDDGDGLIDAADPGCSPVDEDSDSFEDAVEKTLGSDWQDAISQPEHVSVNPGSCVDLSDNDGDSLVDGADDGCVTATNDDIADAIVVDTLPFSHSAKLVDATTEVGERQPSCSSAEEMRGTVWYEFTSPSDTHVVIDTTGSDLISSASVWREGAFGLTEVACNAPLFFYELPAGNRFAFAASAGETYYIQVERFEGEVFGLPLTDLGRLSIHMEATSPPANDDFDGAQPIESLPFTASIDTVAASTEPGEPDASCRFQGYPANSIWYRYTPSSNTYVLASATQGTNFGVTLGAYEGATLGTLRQVACGTELAFHAEAAHTYYMQAAGYQCQSPAGAEGGAASVCFDSRAGRLELRVETLTLPSCPAAQFTMDDPRGDADDDDFPVDIVSLSIGSDDQVACITATLDPPVQPRDIGVWLEIDADLAGPPSYGSSHIYVACDYPTGLNLDHRVFIDRADEGLLASVTDLSVSGTITSHPGYFTYDGSSATLILRLSSIGGDAAFRFAIELSHGDTYDCAPNGGNITCQDGVCAFSPFRNGDVNCNGPANAIDAALVLQYGAGLLPSLSCPDAADVNGNERIDSRDAALILQFTAGLLNQLPPEEPWR